MPMQHLLTIDVEAWYRGLHGRPVPAATDAELSPALDRLLGLLHETATSATFFVLGQDAVSLGDVLRGCSKAGHEIACHGMRHVRADRTGPDGFRRDLREAIAVVEDTVQTRCTGYRAPWFSGAGDSDWFFDVLAEEGIVYDASLRIPVESRLAGTRRRGVILVPVPTVKFGPGRMGILGGMALRALPKWLLIGMLRRCRRSRQPACLYLHPYEWYSSPSGPFSASISTLRRRLLTGRTLPRLRWLATVSDLTSIDRWCAAAP